MYETNCIGIDVFMDTMKKMFPKRTFAEIQNEFFRDCLNVLETDTDTDVITVLPYRCGIGKSTLLQTYIQASLNNSDYGMIIVTDRVKRLESLKKYRDDDEEPDALDTLYYKNKDKISLITMDNKQQEEQVQRFKPILLMTTQRFFQMDTDKLKEFLEYEHDGVKCKRHQIIFDEQPMFYNIHYIGTKALNNVMTALKNGIDDTCVRSVKEWAISQFANFSNYLDEAMKECEYSRRKNTYTWFSSERDSITDDDKKFFRIVEQYRKSILMADRLTFRYLDDFKTLVTQGALLGATKVKAGDRYENTFLVTRDYSDHFFLDDEDVKVFVLDGTADVSSVYSDFCGYIDVKDCSRYNVPMDYMHIHIMHINTSRNALINKDSDSQIKEIIQRCISQQGIKKDDALMVSYKSIIESGFFSGLDFQYGYLGNLRGYNDFKHIHNYIQVGMNRQRDVNYLAMLLHEQPEYIDYLKNMDMAERTEFIDKIISDDPIRDIITQEVTADTIQNIFRIAVRDIGNQDLIHVYLFYDTKYFSEVESNLQYVFGRFGAKIEKSNIPELTHKKIMERKTESGKLSVAQRVIKWIDGLPIGKQFSTSEICKELAITSKQLQKAKENNKGLQEMMRLMIVKRGVFAKAEYPG